MSDVYLNTPANSPGLFSSLEPANQQALAQAALAKQQLGAAQAFQGGIPTDASGNPDYMAMAKTLYAKGDIANAGNIMQTGISQQFARQAAQPSAILGGGAPGPQPTGTGNAAPSSASGANSDVVNYIRTKAAQLGINPNVALGVAGSEGLRGFDPNGNANLGDDGSSAGPFQLHYGGVAAGPNSGPGLGDDFTKATGLDARDPSTWKAQVDYSLQHASQNGWGAWHGAARAGIGAFAGIGGQPQPGAAPTQVAQNGADDSDPAPSTTHPYAPAAPASQAPAPQPATPSAMRVAGSGAPSGGAPMQIGPGAAAGPAAVPVGPAPNPTNVSAQSGASVAHPPLPGVSDQTLGGMLTSTQLQAGGGTAAGVAQEALRAAASLSNNPYAKGQAAALTDLANRIYEYQKAVTMPTGEQKNARDPAVVAQQDQIATIRARARVDAQTDNSLVPVAQPDGSMTLMPKRVAMAQAAAGNGPVTSLPGYVTSGQQNLQTKLSDGSSAFAERQVAEERLNAISNLLSTYQTGANSTAFSNAAAQLRSYGIPVPNSATLNPEAVQEIAKNGYANVLSNMKEQGNKQFVSEVQSAVNSNPNPDLQPAANAAMVAQMQGIAKYHDQNFQDYANWMGANKGASNDAQFQINWAKQNPLGTYISAAAKNIAPMGVPLPPPDKLVDGQAYMVQGRNGQVKARWNAAVAHFVPAGS